MNFEQFKTLVMESFTEPPYPNDLQISNAIFNAIRDAQEDGRCSIGIFDLVFSTSTTKFALANLEYKLDAGDYGYEAATQPKCLVHPFFIHSIFDSTLDPPTIVYPADRDSIIEEAYSGTYISVDYEGSSLKLFSSEDLIGKTLTLRANFVIEYVEGELALGAKTNIFLNTVPVQFRRHLITGVKARLFQNMFLEIGRSDLNTKYVRHEEDWRLRILPFFRQEMQALIQKNKNYHPQAPSIAGISSLR